MIICKATIHQSKVILSILLLLTACAVPHPGPECIKNDTQYGQVDGSFRSQWWNYYQRGQSYLEGECLDAARSDFLAAISQNDRDQRMSRTYGFHFIDYFPHRELGLIYYLLGDLDTAEKELQQSISQESSSKAYHYLDQIRKKRLKKQVQTISTPKITMKNPKQKAIWTSGPIHIQGTVKDDQFVSNIEINGENYDLQASAREISFQKELSLPEGDYKIPIVANNLLGGHAMQLIDIHVDNQGPVVEILAFEYLAANIIVIDGIISDKAGKNRLFVNGQEIALSSACKATFHVKQHINKDQKQLIFKAVDRVGNETKAQINLSDTKKIFADGRLASREFTQDNQLFAKKNQKIILTISEWNRKNNVYTDKIYLQGCISSSAPLQSFLVNSRPITINQARLVFFNIPCQLDEGDNNIKIQLINKRNEVLIRHLTFNRIIPDVLQLDARLHLAMNALTTSDDHVMARDQFQNQLHTSFVDRNRFFLIPKYAETPHELINQSRDRHLTHLSLTGQYIDSRYGVEVAIRVIDNETTKILTVKDVYSDNKDNESILHMIESLTIRIHNEFPIVKGNIQHIQGNDIEISLGKQQLKAQNRLIVFSPSQNKTAPEIIGFARVTETEKYSSKILIIHNKRPISLNDRVITQ